MKSEKNKQYASELSGDFFSLHIDALVYNNLILNPLNFTIVGASHFHDNP